MSESEKAFIKQIVDRIKGGVETSVLEGEKGQIISEIKAENQKDNPDYEIVSRLAKNVMIYEYLIKMKKDGDSIKATASEAEQMGTILDPEFDPLHQDLLDDIMAFAPTDGMNLASSKPHLKSKKRKSKKRKSKGRKSKGRKSKRRKSKRRRR